MTFRGTWISNPTPWPRMEQTWTWFYNRNLIGKDKIYAGPGQVPAYDWPLPNPGPYFDISLRTWASHYNYNLIGKDQFYDGPGKSPVFDYPNPRGYEPDWRRSWEWSYNKNLIGKDKFYDGPGNGPEFDWPNPQPVTWYRSWEQNLLQTTLTVVPTPRKQTDWPLPGQPSRIDQFWTGNNPGRLLPPFRQLDWPNPQPVSWYKSWEAWYNLNLIGQDQLPNRQSDYPNPQPVQWFRDWSVNLQQTTLFVAPQKPFAQYDWPIPVGYPYYVNYGQESFFIQVPPAPFAQYDWPITQPPLQYRDWFQNLLETTLSAVVVVNPFVQTDWPNYRPVTWYQSWEAKYNSNLIGQDQLPIRQQYWPNPYPVQWYQDYGYKYIPELIGQDKLPFRQSDWPVPIPVTWYQDYRLNLVESTLFVTPVKPFFINYDWPNPRDYPRLTDYGFINFTVNIPPPPTPPPVTGGGIQPENFWKRMLDLDREQKDKHLAAVELGRLGGQARAKILPPKQRATLASNAAKARWSAR